MKPVSWKSDHKEMRKCIKWEKSIIDLFDQIDINAEFSFDHIGFSTLRIFFYVGNSLAFFPDKQVQKLKRGLENALDFKNETITPDTEEYNFAHYMWIKSHRKVDGSIIWKRDLPHPWEKSPFSHLILLIENVSPGKCKILKREVIETVYEMDCGGSKVNQGR